MPSANLYIVHIMCCAPSPQELPSPDQMLMDIIENMKLQGICQHFKLIFRNGQGNLSQPGRPALFDPSTCPPLAGMKIIEGRRPEVY